MIFMVVYEIYIYNCIYIASYAFSIYSFMISEARKSFEMKRKKHYNEFQAVKLARKLMEQDTDEEDEDEQDKGREDKIEEESEEGGAEECSADTSVTQLQ